MYLNLTSIFLLTLLGYYFLIKYAAFFGLVDSPNNRSSHTKETPRGFGIIIFLSCLISTAIFKFSFLALNIYFFLAIFLIFTIGVLDDIKGAIPITKIVIPILAFGFLYIDEYLIASLGVYLGHSIDFYHGVSILFTLFALVAYTNAFNLIDGLDGLAGLVAIVILSSFIYIGYINDNDLLIFLPMMLITTLVVFIFFNWNPAQVFLGDCGSLMIGFVISVLGIKSLDYIEPIAILYIAAIPIFDSIVVFFRRVQKKQHPFTPDRNHLHHILLFYTDGNIKKTVLIIATIQAVFSSVGVMIFTQVEDSFVPLIIFVMLLVLVYILTSHYEEKKFEDNFDK